MPVSTRGAAAYPPWSILWLLNRVVSRRDRRGYDDAMAQLERIVVSGDEDELTSLAKPAAALTAATGAGFAVVGGLLGAGLGALGGTRVALITMYLFFAPAAFCFAVSLLTMLRLRSWNTTLISGSPRALKWPEMTIAVVLTVAAEALLFAAGGI